MGERRRMLGEEWSWRKRVRGPEEERRGMRRVRERDGRGGEGEEEEEEEEEEEDFSPCCTLTILAFLSSTLNLVFASFSLLFSPTPSFAKVLTTVTCFVVHTSHTLLVLLLSSPGKGKGDDRDSFRLREEGVAWTVEIEAEERRGERWEERERRWKGERAGERREGGGGEDMEGGETAGEEEIRKRGRRRRDEDDARMKRG